MNRISGLKCSVPRVWHCFCTLHLGLMLSLAGIAQGQVSATPGTIKTLVGTGTAGDSGSGATAQIDLPLSLRLDASGNIIFSESSSYVRKLTAGSTTLVNLAGTGTPGYTGDGGAAASAELNVARGLAVDGSGDIFIADSGNNRVRVIYEGGNVAATLIGLENPAVTAPVVGDIYTVAGTGSTTGGTTGTLAILQGINSPRGLFVDGTGNIYLAENGGNKVRVIYMGGATLASLITLENPKVSAPVMGAMYVLAGSGSGVEGGNGGLAISAGLNPSAVGVDSSGNVFIAEQSNFYVRKVAAATGVISIVAGNGTTGFMGDGGPATAAELGTIRGLWVDGAGDLFLADAGNNCIRKVDGTGTIWTVAGVGGTANAGFSGDGGDATAAELRSPYDVATDAAGNLYIADELNSRIREVNSSSLSFSFGNQALDETTTGQVAIVSNIGGSSLSISGINISPSFSQTATGANDCSAQTVLAPGTYCRLQIAFSPTSVASYTGTALVTTSSGMLTLSLSGAGVIGATKTSLSASPVTALPSSSVTFTATVTSTAGSPVGSVEFLNGTSALSTQTLVGQSATYSTSQLNAGSNTITAKYLGSTGFSGSTSPAVVVLVQYPGAVASNTMLIAPATAIAGQAVTLTATVASTGSSTATGPVTFSSNGVALGQVALSGGTAQLVFTGLPLGNNVLSASYSGDAYTNPSVSNTVSTLVAVFQGGWIPGVINTVAGTGVATDTGDGGLATLSTVNSPFSVRGDSAGNLFFADNGSLVREIVAATGNITTIAGTGTAAFSGDAGPAASAAINLARGIAVDSYGNVYISDSGNNRVRMVYFAGEIAAALISAENPSVVVPVVGNIYTIAGTGSTTGGVDGTLAVSQALNSPRGLEVDGFGNIFLVENGGNHARVIYAGGSPVVSLIDVENPAAGSPVLGNMYILAGTGASTSTGDGGLASAASFSPSEVTLDPAGNLFIAEQGNNRVRKISAITGFISTVAGTGTAGYVGDGSLATAARINMPRGIWADDAGDFYIADTGNNVVRKVDTNGIISTIAGGGTALNDGGPANNAQVAGPYSATLDSQGNLVIASASANRIRSVSAANAVLSFPNTVIGSSSAVETLTFANTGGFPLTPSKITLDPTFTQVSGNSGDCAVGTAIAPGGNCTLRIVASPTQSGSTSGTATLSTNAANGASGNFVAQLSVTGAYPNSVAPSVVLTANPTALDVGQTTVLTVKVVSATAGVSAIPTGRVLFLSGAANLGFADLDSSGNATVSLSQLPKGTTTVTAVYQGDMTYQPMSSNAVSITVYAGPGDFTLGGTVTSATVTAGQAAIYLLSLTSNTGFDQTTTLSCSNLPANASCVFSPAQIAPAVGATVTYGLSIFTGSPLISVLRKQREYGAGATELRIAGCFMVSLCLAFMKRRRRSATQKFLRMAACLLLMMTSFPVVGCGTQSKVAPVTNKGTYNITVTATAGTISHQMNVSLTVQ